jgi:WXG100 family type VII secretion target
MSDKIKLNYPQMQEMAKHLKGVQTRLLQTNRFAKTVANDMQGGALVGDAGEAFATALSNTFIPAVNKFAEKFKEIADDIEKAISDMQSADKDAGAQF